MAVYYKFKSAKDYDTIPIEGQFISVGNLKERIFESKHLGRGTDFDLMISNAQSNEEYVDEAAMIPKNTSVLIRRVPGRPRMPIVTKPDEPKMVDDNTEELPPQSIVLVGDSSTTMKYPEESEWDEFGNDLYAIPEVVPTHSSNPVLDVSPASKIDEENKLKALIETPAFDWSRQGQDGFGSGRGFGRGMGGRTMSGRGFGRGGFIGKTTPPAGYICHRCKVPGHFIQHCPTNGDPNYDVRKVKPPTGIPKSMLMATPDGPYALPSGAVAVLKPNEAAFEKEIEGMPSTKPVSDLPPELRCPLCKEVMKDAVLTSKCCFRSFCDKCIRDYIISKPMCVCGATNILADDLLPNKTLRETISRILESTTSSTENVGSLVQVQDMESARHVPPKIPSPTRSAASKDEPKQTSAVQHSSDVKAGNANEANPVREGNAVNDTIHSLENTLKNTDQSEATPESMSTKEPMSPAEEVQEKSLGGDQGKKKKKKKTRVPGSDMQWRGFQDLGAENYAGMPLGPAAFNPYWGGGMSMGLDGFMAPFGGAMPYMGYAPGPFDVPFGGMLPPDPFAAQGYMMPPLPPRDLSELGFNCMNMNKPPPMSREEFEAMKADIRRKREYERVNEREHPRDGRGCTGKEFSSNGADVAPMKGKARPMFKSDRSDRPSDPDRDRDCHHRESSRHHTPPPPRPRPSLKRRPSEHDERERKEVRERKEEERGAAVAASSALPDQQSKADQKQKGSVFSRISFPEADKDAKRRRTSSSSDTVAAATNGALKDHHHHRSHRDEAGGHRAGSVSSSGYRRSSYEHETSEEEGDEDRHFKRRPSRREREPEEEGMSSRATRARDRSHERRVETKRR